MNTNEVLNKLKAEIERQIKSIENATGDFAEGRRWELENLCNLVTSLQQEQPSLPYDLDEAAKKWKEENFRREYYQIPKDAMSCSFKAGAEWMAGQGVCADAEVCKLADRAWVTPLDEKLFQNEVYDKFKAGDKVVVQIRKK